MINFGESLKPCPRTTYSDGEFWRMDSPAVGGPTIRVHVEGWKDYSPIQWSIDHACQHCKAGNDHSELIHEEAKLNAQDAEELPDHAQAAHIYRGF